jgi:hypothetical protein
MPNVKSEVRRAINLLKKSAHLTSDDLSEEARYNATMDSSWNGNHSATSNAIAALRKSMVNDAQQILRTVHAVLPDDLELDPPVPQTFANQWAAYVKLAKKPHSDYVVKSLDEFRLVFLKPTDYDAFAIDTKFRERLRQPSVIDQAKGFMGVYTGPDREDTEIYVDVGASPTLTHSVGILKDKE